MEGGTAGTAREPARNHGGAVVEPASGVAVLSSFPTAEGPEPADEVEVVLGGHPKPAINGHLKTGHYG
jgi:hypothetical protein